MLALLLASPSTALRPNTTLDPCQGRHVTAKAFRAWSAGVWRLPRWERGDPPRSTVFAAWSKLNCAAGPHHAKSIRHIWRSDRRAYQAHRGYMLELEALTPYGPWAIPEYVVMCESHGDWGAVNPTSGAAGAYQLLPSTYYGVCVTCDWSHLDQHRAARAVWDRSDGSEWVCA